MTWPENLLELPARQAVGGIALVYLQQAAEAAKRLKDAADAEALHDFRVGLRRLRSCLRAHGDLAADYVPKKLRRRIKAIAAATGHARDTEVQLAWLRSEAGAVNPRQRAALLQLESRLALQQKLAYEDIRAEALPDFQRAERKLRKALAALSEAPDDAAQAPLSFAQAVAPLIHQHAVDLKTYLAQFRSPARMEEAHLARISAKRLRYLLEPFAPQTAPGDAVIRELKGMQDLLGELRDAQLFTAALAAAMEDAAVEHARHLLQLALMDRSDPAALRTEQRRTGFAGFLAAARIAQARREQLFKRIRAEHGGKRMAAFTQQLIGLADQLTGSPAVGNQGHGGASAARP